MTPMAELNALWCQRCRAIVAKPHLCPHEPATEALPSAPVASAPKEEQAKQWMVVRKRDTDAPEVWIFDRYDDAAVHWDNVQANWTEVWFCRVAYGPKGAGMAGERPTVPSASPRTVTRYQLRCHGCPKCPGVIFVHNEGDPIVDAQNCPTCGGVGFLAGYLASEIDPILSALAETEAEFQRHKDRSFKLYTDACNRADKFQAALAEAEELAQKRLDWITAHGNLRETLPCPCCRWPMAPDNEHAICECCGFQVSYNVPERYEWDGKWWMNDPDYPPPQIVQNLLAALAEREQETARLKAALASK